MIESYPVGAIRSTSCPVDAPEGAIWCQSTTDGYQWRWRNERGVWVYVSDTIPTYEAKHDPS